MNRDAYIYSGLRTPIGRYGGALSSVRPDDLLAGVLAKLVSESSFRPEDFEDVIMGCTSQAGEDARNVARHAALVAGLPTSLAAQTVNRLCGRDRKSTTSELQSLMRISYAVFCLKKKTKKPAKKATEPTHETPDKT